MFDALVALAVLACAITVFATTRRGRRLRARLAPLGTRGGAATLAGKRASDEDHAFLLRICEGDYERLQAKLAAELDRNPHLSEAEAYRKAIRRHMRGG